MQNTSVWNNIYGNGTNSSSHGNLQLQDDNNSLPHDECRLYNGTNSSSQNVLQSYSPDVDVTDLIIRCGLTPLFLLIGLAGNTSTIVVFKRQLKRGPTVMFIISLAFCDLSFLLLRVVAIVYAWFQMFAPETIRYVRPNTLFWIVFSNTFQRAGGWFIIVIIIERLVAVWFPFNLRDISTRKRAKCIITFVITTTLIITIPWDTSILLHSLTEEIPATGPVSTQREGMRYLPTRSAWMEHWQTVAKALFDLMPIPMILTLNLLVIAGIRRSMGLRLSNLNARQKQQQRITHTLLTIAIAYCLLCGPYTLYSTLVVERVIDISDVPNIASEIFRMLVLLNSTINFLIYGVTDRSVRQDYVRLLRCGKANNDADDNIQEQQQTSKTDNIQEQQQTSKTDNIQEQQQTSKTNTI